MLIKKMKKKKKPQKLAERKKANSQRQQQQKMDILVAGDFMLTGISGKGLSKKHNVSVAIFLVVPVKKKSKS